MKTAALITSALFVLSGFSDAEITFYKVFDSDIEEAGACGVVEVPDGGYAFLSCNWSWNFLRTDSVGNVLAQHCNVSGYTMCLNDAGELVVAEMDHPDSVLLHWTDQMGVVNRSKSYYPGGNDLRPREIIATFDGGYAVCGYFYSSFPGGFLLRIDDQENLQWIALFDTLHSYSLAETPDSGFIVGGSDTEVSYEASLTWVDSNGIEGQTRQYGSGNVVGITPTSTGYAILPNGPGTPGDIVGIDLAGDVQWIYTSDNIDIYYDICIADNGDVVAVGYNWSEKYSGLTRLNPDDGTPLWERIYPDCILHRLTATADGGFAMAGIRPGYPYDDIILIKTDSEGLCPEMGIEEGVTPGDDIGLQVCPNPCSGSASVRFSLSEPANVQLSIYDISGRQVGEEPNQTLNAGSQSIAVQDLNPGIYFLRLTADGNQHVQRFAVVSN